MLKVLEKHFHKEDFKNKILLVSNSTWNIHNFRTNLIKHFVAQGYEVFVAAPIDRYMNYLNELPGVSHIPLNYLKRDSKSIIENIHCLLELRKVYKRVAPDLVIQFTIKPNILGSIAARTVNVSCTSVVTGLGYTFLDGTWLKMITKWLYRISLKKCKKVVFENPDDHDLFLNMKLIREEQAVVVNGCGVDIERFRPSSKIQNRNYKVFTFIGRLLFDKGIREFVEAARQLKENGHNIIFWVVGDVDTGNPSSVSRQTLMKWINEKVIIYQGATDEIKPFIEKSDCVVLPSYREGLPKVLLEAMAMGKPIITTDVAGCRETVVHGKNGFLVKGKSESELVAAIDCIGNLPINELNVMGENSRKLVEERFRNEIVMQQFMDFLFPLYKETPQALQVATLNG